jgi:PTS system fructose-specific IIC component
MIMITVVAVTACPTGIAHTHMAAEALLATASLKGFTIKIERQSAQGIENVLSSKEIASADVVLIAADIHVDMARFSGKKIYTVSTSQAIRETGKVFDAVKNLLTEERNQMTDQQTGNTSSPQGSMKIVAITACPTGIAHTFMAAEALTKAATSQGHQIHVETQGSVGAKTPLSQEQIEAANLVIIAADTHVDDSRFSGKRVYKTSVSAAVKQPDNVLNEAVEHGRVLGGSDNYAESVKQAKATKSGQRSGPYKHLLTGVSYMLPIVVAGGLLIALSFVFGIKAFEEEGTLAAALMSIGGGAAFKIMVPVLAGFIAFSIADRPGLAPGLIGGMLAINLNSGFLGGIVAGFLAGYVALWLRDNIKLPANLEGLKPVLVIPLISTLVVGLLMVYVIGEPVSAILETLTEFLKGMSSTNAIMLGLLLGGMMAVDMGGPVNKAAYTFAVGLLTSETYAPMAAVMAAGMTPPLGLALATIVAKNRFSRDEREAGKAAAVLGISFITEGAIPFAAKDPARVIPSIIVGSAVTGALSMMFGCKLLAPHGGIFVLAIPNAVTGLALYALAIAIGTVVTTGMLMALKRPVEEVVS